MNSAVRQESLVDRAGLWAGGWGLSASVWGPVQVVVRPDKVLGDGGLGGIGLLAMLVGWVFLVVVGVATFREVVHERSEGEPGLAIARVVGLGVVAWLAERETLVVGGHRVTTGVALMASLLMPLVFIAALWIVTSGGRQRRGWQVLATVCVLLAALRIPEPGMANPGMPRASRILGRRLHRCEGCGDGRAGRGGAPTCE